jgi:hypothetical protein
LLFALDMRKSRVPIESHPELTPPGKRLSAALERVGLLPPLDRPRRAPQTAKATFSHP